MALLLDFTEAENVRNELTEEQKEAIENLFVKLSKDIQKQAEKAPRVPSDALRKQYLYDLQKKVDKAVDGFRHDIQGMIEGNMEKTAEAVVGCNLDFLQAIGMPIEGAFSHVPIDTVISVATGQLYEGNWTLARQLWKQSVHTQKDVNTVIANGIAANKSAYDIAKDLEKYVNPKARKEWDWSKVYPGTSKKVDYNAQRLARTMVSHAYQQAFVKTTQKNPFVTEYEWQASNSERTCELCEERDGQHYAKDDLPLDHPNGMCTFVAVMPDDMETIADRLADWVNGKEDLELDAWAKSLYGEGWDKQALSNNTSGIVQGRDLSGTWQRRADEFPFAIDDVINAQGFDGLPQVVSSDEFNRLVQENGVICKRGYTAPTQESLQAYREQLYYGNWYVDCSSGGASYGQGMYAVGTYGIELTPHMEQVVGIYGGSGYIETFTLQEAKIINSKAIDGEKREAIFEFIKSKAEVSLSDEQGALLRLLTAAPMSDKERDYATNLLSNVEEVKFVTELQAKLYSNEFVTAKMSEINSMDDGVFAALRGYDAIQVDVDSEGGKYFAILNRTKCVFKGEGAE